MYAGLKCSIWKKTEPLHPDDNDKGSGSVGFWVGSHVVEGLLENFVGFLEVDILWISLRCMQDVLRF